MILDFEIAPPHPPWMFPQIHAFFWIASLFKFPTLIPDLPCCFRRTFSGFISQWMILLRYSVSKHWRRECANFRTSCRENPWNLFFFISSYKLIDKSSKVMQVWDLQIFTFLFNHFYILFTRGFEMCIFKIQKRHIQAKLEAKLPFYIYTIWLTSENMDRTSKIHNFIQI